MGYFVVIPLPPPPRYGEAGLISLSLGSRLAFLLVLQDRRDRAVGTRAEGQRPGAGGVQPQTVHRDPAPIPAISAMVWAIERYPPYVTLLRTSALRTPAASG